MKFGTLQIRYPTTSLVVVYFVQNKLVLAEYGVRKNNSRNISTQLFALSIELNCVLDTKLFNKPKLWNTFLARLVSNFMLENHDIA